MSAQKSLLDEIRELSEKSSVDRELQSTLITVTFQIRDAARKGYRGVKIFTKHSAPIMGYLKHQGFECEYFSPDNRSSFVMVFW